MNPPKTRDRSLDRYRRLLLNPENRDLAKQEFLDLEVMPYGCTPSVPDWLRLPAKAWQDASSALDDAEHDAEFGFNEATQEIVEQRKAEFEAACSVFDQGLEWWLDELAAEASAIPLEDLAAAAPTLYPDDDDEEPDWLPGLDRSWRS